MYIVNMFGAPGAGKSTGAAYVFATLKTRGVNAELVTEFAKDMVWDDNRAAFQNQAYIFGEQYYRISRLEGKVDAVVTDSPLLLSSYYCNNELLGKEFDAIVTRVSNSYPSINVFIDRAKPYNTSGRIHSEEESDNMAKSMIEFLYAHGIQPRHYDGTIEGYEELSDYIAQTIAKRGQLFLY